MAPSVVPVNRAGSFPDSTVAAPNWSLAGLWIMNPVMVPVAPAAPETAIS